MLFGFTDNLASLAFSFRYELVRLDTSFLFGLLSPFQQQQGPSAIWFLRSCSAPIMGVHTNFLLNQTKTIKNNTWKAIVRFRFISLRLALYCL